MDDRERTLTAIRDLKWTVVLLEPGTKRLLSGRTWEECSTNDPRRINRHLKGNGGIGLDVHTSGIIVVDIDVTGAFAQLAEELGPLPLTASSPSHGLHCYFARPAVTLPASLHLKDGTRVGEILRGPRQQVVMPPSPYPGNEKRGVPPGGFYAWEPNVNLLGAYHLPPDWLRYLAGEQIPDWMPREPIGHPEDDESDKWNGPDPEQLLARARSMPASKRRANGVKFQCPKCREEGHDKHKDNAMVRLDGRWGCAFAPGNKEHIRAIGVALGVIVDKPPIKMEKDEPNLYRKTDLTKSPRVL